MGIFITLQCRFFQESSSQFNRRMQTVIAIVCDWDLYILAVLIESIPLFYNVLIDLTCRPLMAAVGKCQFQ